MSKETIGYSEIDETALDPADRALAFLDDAIRGGVAIAAALQVAVVRYPDQVSLLVDYAAVRAASAPEPSAATDIRADEAHLIVATVMSGISTRIKEIGVEVADFCSRLHIGKSMLLKLDRRLIDLKTIPQAFLDEMSHDLRVAVSALNEYLSAPPRLAASAEYKSSAKPSALRQETFQRALAAAQSAGEISAADTNYWIVRERGE